MLLYCLAALVCLPVPSLAQRYSFREYTEGLGNLAINCIAQDRTGFLWVGTENGLYRYDGHEFRQFGPADGMRARAITGLFVDLDGTLWVGANPGIFFQKHDGGFREVPAPAPLNQFSLRIGSAFTSAAQGQVIAASREGAFLLRQLEAERWVAEPLHLDGQEIWSVYSAPDKTLWYGCGDDLCRLTAGKTTRMRAALNLPAQHWQHLFMARDGHLWLRGATHLGEFIPGENRLALHDLPGKSIETAYGALAEDARGRMVTIQGPSFGTWEHGRWRMLTQANGLGRNDLSTVFVDREGSIWMGVVGHGLKRWLGRDRWEAYTVADGLNDDLVWDVLRDREGRLWVSTESGLNWIPRDSNTPKTWQAPGIATVRADALAESADGSIWMGSAAGNLVRINPRTLAGTQWKVPEVYRITASDAGGVHRLWVATGQGLYVVDTASARPAPRLVEDAAIAHPRQRFSDLCLDAQGVLWAASDQGLFRLDEHGWVRIDPGLSNIVPYLIAADLQGNLWATGSFSGVVRLRLAGSHVVEAEHIGRPRLLSDQVAALAVDRRGWLWLGQDDGLTVYDGKQWRSFTQDDGLIWNDCDADALNEDTDGSMWIGTSGGLSHLLAPREMAAGPPPFPVFSQATFGKATVENGAEIPWSASPLTVSIASLSFRNSNNIHFRYRLEGLENEWVETSEGTIRYPRLAPGSYRLQAVAVDTESRMHSHSREIAFTIQPEWWQGWWMQALAALLVALAGGMVWHWRTRLLVLRTQELALAVRRRTEDLEKEKAELLRTREQMRHYAEHDDLTGLWNHRVILERLRQEVDRSRRECTPLSVILVDLDKFKLKNDTYGHPAGDSILKETAAVFSRSVRAYDWVGRYGGEEFLLILPATGFENARARAEQLRAAVQVARMFHGEMELHITASFGVASGFPSDVESVIQTADAALYRAKHNGRNCVTAVELQPASGDAVESACSRDRRD